MEKIFPGFSFDKEKQTPIPASFFTHVLPEVRDLALLKIILYTLWWHSRAEATPPYITLENFTKDSVFMAGLGDNSNTQLDALREGLKTAVDHNILLTANFTIGNKAKHIYLLNTHEGQVAIEAIRKGNIQITEDEMYPIKLDLEFPNIFALYEENIGPITPIIAEALKEIENLYPPRWIEEAFEEAIKNNVRKLRYIEVILENWQKEGRNDRTDRRRSKKSGKEDDPERYIKGEFSDFIEH